MKSVKEKAGKRKEKALRELGWGTQVYAFIERNLNLTRKFFAWEIVWMIYHIVWALSTAFLGYGMSVVSGAAVDTDRIVLFLVTGTVLWTYLSTIFYEIGYQVQMERWEGTIEYTFMAPVRRILHLLGSSGFAVCYGILRAVIVIFVVFLVFNVSVPNANFIGALALLLIASFSFIGLGMMVSVIPLISLEKGPQAVHIVEAVLMLFSGIFYPITVLPIWMQAFSKILPSTYILEGARHAMLDGYTFTQLWPYVWPIIIAGIVLIPAGIYVFSIGEKYAKRAGKLKRFG